MVLSSSVHPYLESYLTSSPSIINPNLNPLDSNIRQDRSHGTLPKAPPTTSIQRRGTLPRNGGSSNVAGEANGEASIGVSEAGRGRPSISSALSGGGRTNDGDGGAVAEEEDELDEYDELEGDGEGRVGEASASGAERARKRKGTNPGLTSCVACRRGKRRCEPTPLVPASHPDAAKLPCARCRRFALECVRGEIKKRKGPAAVDLSAISDAVYGFPSGEEPLMEMPATPMPLPTPMPEPTPVPLATPKSMTGVASGSRSASTHFPFTSISEAVQGQRPGSAQGPGYDLGWLEDQRRSSALSGISAVSHDQMGYASSLRGGSSHHSGDPSPSFHLNLDQSPSSATTSAPLPDNLDQVVSAPVVSTIIGLFFDYIYPLTPCLHRPTFLACLSARLDKTDPVFFALTLTVLASTLVQVPRSLINLDKAEVEELARRCVRIARAKIAFIYEESVPVEINFVVMAYFQGIVHLFLGNNTAHIMCTSNAYYLALAMRLNEESSYEGLDPIESEIRRRTYWLLFQADKSTACMRARTINLRLEDAASLRLPAEVDDEQITSSGILMQPSGRTPIIAGFNVVTHLFRIMNDALLVQRRKAPHTVASILADLEFVNELREKLLRTTREVSSKLQLKTSMNSRVSSPAHDWEATLEARFLNFFESAGDETHALNSYLVLQGNILVTQSVVRLVLLHSKESLLAQLAAIAQVPVEGMGNLAGMQASEPAEEIACELLDGLNSLPVECVATNGPSLVQKVRFVAIQLMECSVAPSPTTTRAQKLLMQFLAVLSVIEGMYTFGKDISAE